MEMSRNSLPRTTLLPGNRSEWKDDWEEIARNDEGDSIEGSSIIIEGEREDWTGMVINYRYEYTIIRGRLLKASVTVLDQGVTIEITDTLSRHPSPGFEPIPLLVTAIALVIRRKHGK